MKFFVIFSALFLSSCGWWSREVVAAYTGYDKLCISGVSYLQFPSGVTPELTQDGKVKPCK